MPDAIGLNITTESDETLEALRRDPRRAIEEGVIVCLICGRAFRQLTNTHLGSHGVTSVEYKQRFGYNLGRPLMCLALRRLYAERAIRFGLASYIRHRPIVSEPELRRRGGSRPIALEELLNRQEVHRSARRRILESGWALVVPAGAGDGLSSDGQGLRARMPA